MSNKKNSSPSQGGISWKWVAVIVSFFTAIGSVFAFLAFNKYNKQPVDNSNNAITATNNSKETEKNDPKETQELTATLDDIKKTISKN